MILNKPLLILTPSFHPAMGMTPSTDTVMMTMMRVAKDPTMMLLVAITRIGNAKASPIAIPIVAEETRRYK